MIHYEILAPNRVGAAENADLPSRADRRFRFPGNWSEPKRGSGGSLTKQLFVFGGPDATACSVLTR